MSASQTRTAFNEKEDALHYRAMARRLADMAMEMAEAVLQEAKTVPEPGAPIPDHTIRFERASRTVRRAILLARKLAEPLPDARPALDRTTARKRIIREVEDAIYREHHQTPRDRETLEAELLDRLDRPDLEDDLATRPIEHIITDLVRDLGVGLRQDEKPRLWKLRTKQDITILEARAAAPVPAEPRPPRTTAPIPLPWFCRIELPEDNAKAVGAVLAMGKIRDG